MNNPHPTPYPPTFKVEACEAADKACVKLNLQAAVAKLNNDWDGYVKACRAAKVLWLDSYHAAVEQL